MNNSDDTLYFEGSDNSGNTGESSTPFTRHSDNLAAAAAVVSMTKAAPEPMRLAKPTIGPNSSMQVQSCRQSSFTYPPQMLPQPPPTSTHSFHTSSVANQPFFHVPVQTSTGAPVTIALSDGDAIEFMKIQKQQLALQQTQVKLIKGLTGMAIGVLVIISAIFVAQIVTMIVWQNTGTTINNFSETGMPLMARMNGIASYTQNRLPDWFTSIDGLANTVHNWTDSHSEKLFETMDAFTDDPFAMYNLIFDTLDSAHATITPLQNHTAEWVATVDEFFVQSKNLLGLLGNILNQANSVGIDNIALMIKEVVQQVFDLLNTWNDFRNFKRLAGPSQP
jgi:hypothetical protein